MDWKTIVIDGEFRINAPEDATHRLDDGGATFVLTVKTTPETEMLISRFNFSSAEFDAKTNIEQKVVLFGEAIGRTKKRELRFSVVTNFDAERNFYISQLVTTWTDAETECAWIARGYAKAGYRYFYLLHWNGLKEDAFKDVIRILGSFEPDFD